MLDYHFDECANVIIHDGCIEGQDSLGRAFLIEGVSQAALKEFGELLVKSAD